MTKEEFEKKVQQVETNIKVIEAYDKLLDQVKQVDKVINKESESE